MPGVEPGSFCTCLDSLLCPVCSFQHIWWIMSWKPVAYFEAGFFCLTWCLNRQEQLGPSEAAAALSELGGQLRCQALPGGREDLRRPCQFVSASTECTRQSATCKEGQWLGTPGGLSGTVCVSCSFSKVVGMGVALMSILEKTIGLLLQVLLTLYHFTGPRREEKWGREKHILLSQKLLSLFQAAFNQS